MAITSGPSLANRPAIARHIEIIEAGFSLDLIEKCDRTIIGFDGAGSMDPALISGRKGTGKTAVAAYISSKLEGSPPLQILELVNAQADQIVEAISEQSRTPLLLDHLETTSRGEQWEAIIGGLCNRPAQKLVMASYQYAPRKPPKPIQLGAEHSEAKEAPQPPRWKAMLSEFTFEVNVADLEGQHDVISALTYHFLIKCAWQGRMDLTFPLTLLERPWDKEDKLELFKTIKRACADARSKGDDILQAAHCGDYSAWNTFLAPSKIYRGFRPHYSGINIHAVSRDAPTNLREHLPLRPDPEAPNDPSRYTCNHIPVDALLNMEYMTALRNVYQQRQSSYHNSGHDLQTDIKHLLSINLTAASNRTLAPIRVTIQQFTKGQASPLSTVDSVNETLTLHRTLNYEMVQVSESGNLVWIKTSDFGRRVLKILNIEIEKGRSGKLLDKLIMRSIRADGHPARGYRNVKEAFKKSLSKRIAEGLLDFKDGYVTLRHQLFPENAKE